MDQVTIIDGKVFECNQCGACCRCLNFIPEMREYDIGNGVCRYLDNNKCSIYNQRPDICRGEYLYHKFYDGMDVDEYYHMLNKYCDLIRKGQVNWGKTT